MISEKEHDRMEATETLTPGRVIGIILTIVVGIMTVVNGAMYAIINEKTDGRYRATDAERDFRLVEFRFIRNERDIARCLEFIEDHKENEDH